MEQRNGTLHEGCVPGKTLCQGERSGGGAPWVRWCTSQSYTYRAVNLRNMAESISIRSKMMEQLILFCETHGLWPRAAAAHNDLPGQLDNTGQRNSAYIRQRQHRALNIDLQIGDIYSYFMEMTYLMTPYQAWEILPSVQRYRS